MFLQHQIKKTLLCTLFVRPDIVEWKEFITYIATQQKEISAISSALSHPFQDPPFPKT